MSQTTIGRLIIAYACAGAHIVRLMGDDTCIFGRGGMEFAGFEAGAAPGYPCVDQRRLPQGIVMPPEARAHPFAGFVRTLGRAPRARVTTADRNQGCGGGRRSAPGCTRARSRCSRTTSKELRCMSPRGWSTKKEGFVPTTIVTDHLAAYVAAMSDLRLSAMQERGKRKNNRAESSHVPIRRRERKMQGFKSLGSAQRFLSIHASIYNNFNTCRHLISAANYRQLRSEAFAAWRRAAGIAA
jgi:hypothetical protein